jgi:hypothetical protein
LLTLEFDNILEHSTVVRGVQYISEKPVNMLRISMSLLLFFAVLLIAPDLMAGPNNPGYKKARKYTRTVTTSKTTTLRASVLKESTLLYDSLGLQDLGLNQKAFRYAWAGYKSLKRKGKLTNPDYITICDFSQSSKNKRLYVINLQTMKVERNTYVAHGKKSGGEFARSFSNRAESHKSSLGFYVTGMPYYGEHGLSLRIIGLEKGINDKALARSVVIHGCEYVGPGFLTDNPFSGRSYGCPAIPSDETEDVINLIKEGSCLFIYHPTKVYLTKSKILNG